MFLLSLPFSQWIKAKTQIVNTEESRVSLSLSNSSSMCVSLCACPNEKHFITESKQLTVCEHTGCISVPIISAGSDQASSLQESRGHIGYHSILPYPTHKYAHTHTRLYKHSFPHNSKFYLSNCIFKQSLQLSRSKKNKSTRIRVATVSLAANPQPTLWQHSGEVVC